jgi:hypothetical protein
VSRERDQYSFWCRSILVLASVHEIVTWPKYTCIWAVRDGVIGNRNSLLRAAIKLDRDLAGDSQHETGSENSETQCCNPDGSCVSDLV